RAERAGAGATVPGDHESGRAFGPALPMIGTTGALADGVKLQLVEQGAGIPETVLGGQASAEPGRQTRPRYGFNVTQAGPVFFRVYPRNPRAGPARNPPALRLRLRAPAPNPGRKPESSGRRP